MPTDRENPTTMPSVTPPPKTLDSKTQRNFEEALKRWDDVANEVVVKIAESERLTADDFSIRINAR